MGQHKPPGPLTPPSWHSKKPILSGYETPFLIFLECLLRLKLNSKRAESKEKTTLASMLRKYNRGFTGDLLWIFINYYFLHTNPTPLWGKVFSQSPVLQLSGEKFALHCFSHLFQSIPSSFWRTTGKIGRSRT